MSDFNLFLLNKLAQLKHGGGGGAAGGESAQFLDTNVASTTTGQGTPAFMVQSVNLRTAHTSSQSGYWSSSMNSYSTFQPHTENIANNTVSFFGASGTVNPFSGRVPALQNSTGFNAAFTPHQQVIFGDHYVMQMDHYQNAVGSYSTSYPPIMYSIMFVKNTTDTQISRTFYTRMSVNGNSGYTYASVASFTPNAATYGGVTDVTYSRLANQTGSSNNWSSSQTLTVPAKTTVAVVLYTSCHYNTGIYNGYQTMYKQGFYNLHTLLDTTLGLQCDAKATLAYVMLNDSASLGQKATDYSDIVRFYNSIGEIYGENE